MNKIFRINDAIKSLGHADKLIQLHKNNKSKISHEHTGRISLEHCFRETLFWKVSYIPNGTRSRCVGLLYLFQQNIALSRTFPIMKLLLKISSLFCSKSVPTTLRDIPNFKFLPTISTVSTSQLRRCRARYYLPPSLDKSRVSCASF